MNLLYIHSFSRKNKNDLINEGIIHNELKSVNYNLNLNKR
jgi:hypothetical protein